MEIREIVGLTDEQVIMVERYAREHEDRVRMDYSKKLKDANEELAKLKPAEKSETELQLEQRIAAIESREKEVAEKERSMEIASKLKQKGLPVELSQYLSIGEDIDADIEKFGNAIGDYFLGTGNKPANHRTNAGVTKEDFKRMSYSERTKLFQENNELYRILSK